MGVPVYCFNDAQEMYRLLTGIKFFLESGIYQTGLTVAVVLAIGIGVTMAFWNKDQALRVAAALLIPIVIVLSLLGARETVNLQDEFSLSDFGAGYSVDNIPLGIAYPLWISSVFEKICVDIFDQQVRPIDVPEMKKVDFLGMARLMAEVSSSNVWIGHPVYLSAVEFIKNCVIPQLNTNVLSIETLKNASNIFNVIDTANNVYFTTYYDPDPTCIGMCKAVIGCGVAYGNLDIDTIAVTSSYAEGSPMRRLNQVFGYNGTNAALATTTYDTILSSLFAGRQDSMDVLLRQNLFINAIKGAVTDIDPALSAAMSESESRYFSTAVVGAMNYIKILPTMRMYFRMLMVAMFPVVCFFFFFSSGTPFLAWAGSFFWISMWLPIQAAIHAVYSIHLISTLKSITNLSGGYSYANSLPILRWANEATAVAGGLMIIIPILSAMVIRWIAPKIGSSISGLLMASRGLGSEIQGSAQNAVPNVEKHGLELATKEEMMKDLANMGMRERASLQANKELFDLKTNTPLGSFGQLSPPHATNSNWLQGKTMSNPTLTYTTTSSSGANSGLTESGGVFGQEQQGVHLDASSLNSTGTTNSNSATVGGVTSRDFGESVRITKQAGGGTTVTVTDSHGNTTTYGKADSADRSSAVTVSATGSAEMSFSGPVGSLKNLWTQLKKMSGGDPGGKISEIKERKDGKDGFFSVRGQLMEAIQGKTSHNEQWRHQDEVGHGANKTTDNKQSDAVEHAINDGGTVTLRFDNQTGWTTSVANSDSTTVGLDQRAGSGSQYQKGDTFAAGMESKNTVTGSDTIDLNQVFGWAKYQNDLRAVAANLQGPQFASLRELARDANKVEEIQPALVQAMASAAQESRFSDLQQIAQGLQSHSSGSAQARMWGEIAGAAHRGEVYTQDAHSRGAVSSFEGVGGRGKMPKNLDEARALANPQMQAAMEAQDNKQKQARQGFGKNSNILKIAGIENEYANDFAAKMLNGMSQKDGIAAVTGFAAQWNHVFAPNNVKESPNQFANFLGVQKYMEAKAGGLTDQQALAAAQKEINSNQQAAQPPISKDTSFAKNFNQRAEALNSALASAKQQFEQEQSKAQQELAGKGKDVQSKTAYGQGWREYLDGTFNKGIIGGIKTYISDLKDYFSPSHGQGGTPTQGQGGVSTSLNADPTSRAAQINPEVYAHNGLIFDAAQKYHVSPALLAAVITQESHGNAKAVPRDENGKLTSSAQGLMQLTEDVRTDPKYNVTDGFDPKKNVDGGAHYLHDLLVKYKGDEVKALAAYHVGPGNVDKFLEQGQSASAELKSTIQTGVNYAKAVQVKEHNAEIHYAAMKNK